MIQRFLLAFAVLGLTIPAAVAQTTPAVIPAAAAPVTPDPLWHQSMKTGLGLNESLLSSNWRGGGVNTIGFNALFNARSNRKSGVHSFDNEADLLFAFSQTKGLGYRKGQDRLYLDTKYGRALSERWDMFLSLNQLCGPHQPALRYSSYTYLARL